MVNIQRVQASGQPDDIGATRSGKEEFSRKQAHEKLKEHLQGSLQVTDVRNIQAPPRYYQGEIMAK